MYKNNSGLAAKNKVSEYKFALCFIPMVVDFFLIYYSYKQTARYYKKKQNNCINMKI